MKVKLCGLRRLADISYVNAAMPDYIGFVFAESRRRVSDETAAHLRSKLHPKIQAVGVFVNEPIPQLLDRARAVGLDVVQLHGDEDVKYIQQLKAQLGSGVSIWKAVQAKDVDHLQQVAAFPVDHLLIDAFSKDAYGGTGKTADWQLLKEANLKMPFFLAGGLGIENIEEAIKTVNPFGVDISSGIETDGVKDKQKIDMVMKRIREMKE